MTEYLVRAVGLDNEIYNFIFDITKAVQFLAMAHTHLDVVTVTRLNADMTESCLNVKYATMSGHGWVRDLEGNLEFQF